MAKRRILVVDDDPILVEVSCDLLTFAGHDCRGATRGDDALQIAETFFPQIVIIDLDLGDISGCELARRLRPDTSADTPHLVALTGWSRPRDRDAAFAAGFHQFVLKPGDLQQVIGTAESALGRSAGN